MKNLSLKSVLMVLLSCTLFVACSDDDDNNSLRPISQSELEGFWRFYYGDDPMLKTTWADDYYEFTGDGVRHNWYKISSDKFIYTGSYKYQLKGTELYLTDDDEQYVLTVYLNENDELVIRNSKGLRDTFKRYTKPEGLPYEKEIREETE